MLRRTRSGLGKGNQRHGGGERPLSSLVCKYAELSAAATLISARDSTGQRIRCVQDVRREGLSQGLDQGDTIGEFYGAHISGCP